MTMRSLLNWGLAGLLALPLVACEEREEGEMPGAEEQAYEPGQGAFGTERERADEQQEQQRRQQEQQEQRAEQQRAQPGQQQQQQQGSLRGVLREVHMADGHLIVEANGERTELRARPGDLANFNQGDAVALNWQDFEGTKWLAPRGARAVPQGAAELTIAGEIENLDMADGTVEIAGQTLHSHPQQLQNFQQGQGVTAKYAEIDGQKWLTNIQQGQQQGQQRMQQNQQQQRQERMQQPQQRQQQQRQQQ